MASTASFKQAFGKKQVKNAWMLCLGMLIVLLAVPVSLAIAMPEFTDCKLTPKGGSASIQAKCTQLTVPENPDDPNGKQIQLKIVIVPAKHRNKMPDPLFLLAGGPGQAISEAFPAIADSFEKIREDRDLVLVDQRGTGGSNPLDCPSSEKLLFSPDESARYIIECADNLDFNPQYYTTLNYIKDLEYVRNALGYDQINLYGASYGTLVAQVYANRYPDRIRAMILDGVAHPGYRVFFDYRQSIPRALEKLFSRCKEDPDCNKAFPNLKESFLTILERLESEPVPVRIKNPKTGEIVQFDMTRERFLQAVMPLLYAPETIALLPLTLHAAAEFNDYEPLAGQSASVDMGIYPGLMFSVVCAEDVPFFPPETKWPEPGPLEFREHALMVCKICSQWHTTSQERIPDPVISHIPVLLLSGDADPVTPPESAEKTAAFYPESLHISLSNMGHGIINRGCIRDIAADFIRSGSVTGLDVSCAEDILPAPFFVNFNGPKP
ncbi:alpha/beta fold hydrolase [bacterium]|nr:alpha/beta fold hydrolase [candidate division CSSED10-310 bacterium]